MSRRAAPMLRICVVAACMLLLAACASRQSRDQYEERLEQAVAVRVAIAEQLDQDELDDAEEYRAAAVRVERALDELDADPPPRGLENGHDRMVAGMEGLAALLVRRGRCEALADRGRQDQRACRQAIGQDVYDDIRNDFHEADTIYREEGFSLPGLGGEGGGADAGDVLEDTGGEDEL